MPAGGLPRRPISTSRTGPAVTTAGPARPGPRTRYCRDPGQPAVATAGKAAPGDSRARTGEFRRLGLEHGPGAQAPAVPAPGRDEVFHRGRVLDRGLAGVQQFAADEHRAIVTAAERHAQEHTLVLNRQHQDRLGPAGKPASQARPGGRQAVHHDPFRVDRLVAERCRDLRRHIRRQQALDGCGHPRVHGG